MILQHYRRKMKPHPNGANIGLFVIDTQMLLLPPVKAPVALLQELYQTLEVETIPVAPTSFDGSLEIRVNVKKLSKKGTMPVSLDVMSILRAPGLKGVQGVSLK